MLPSAANRRRKEFAAPISARRRVAPTGLPGSAHPGPRTGTACGRPRRQRPRELRAVPPTAALAQEPAPVARRRRRHCRKWDACQTRTQLQLGLWLPLQQFLDERRDQAGALLLRLRAPGQLLGQLPEQFGGAMARRYFRDHLAVVRRRAEQLWLERDDRDGL